MLAGTHRGPELELKHSVVKLLPQIVDIFRGCGDDKLYYLDVMGIPLG